MKNLIPIVLLSLSAATAFSAPAKHFYKCSGLGGVDEYRVGINLNSKKAVFFDNDANSYMKLTKSEAFYIGKPQTKMTFEGKDANGSGTLRLSFYLPRKTVTLVTISKTGKISEIGEAKCANEEPWEDLE